MTDAPPTTLTQADSPKKTRLQKPTWKISLQELA
jgi:hypothetical protein